MQIGLYIKIQKEKDDPKFNYFKIKLILGGQELNKARGELICNVKNVPIIFTFVLPVKFKQTGILKAEIEFWWNKTKVLDVTTDSNELNFFIDEADSPTSIK